MIKVIIKQFIKNYDDIDDVNVREDYIILSGGLGIINNLLLFLIKLIIGLMINSIAVISDAFNNLSDLGTSLVTIFGGKLSNMPPDREHPYGHGRFEYVATLVVSFIIFAVGLQLLRSSFNKVINPEEVIFSWPSIIILLASISIKLWMFSYNRYIGELIDSSISRAVAHDSINDVLSTSAVVVGTIIGNYVTFPIDGILGIIISIIIIYSAFTIAKDSIDLILGPAPDSKTIEAINSIVLAGDGIKGTHDLIVHDYGPGRIRASIHAEVSENVNIVDIHNEIDRIEKEIKDKLGISIVIHMDPV